ncbi:hypothetical protein AMJ44_12180 [candidate division WOR-1 bacterium DG_54_3]|uniref:Uncharacterized protein n=1 Tax=candidate division WOR-1 bacterium DG_54_3 TaxID=1703775 RepID=A0A0S7XS77_UNCSA|nr:MAG: hypothetical protein AMJ44_12180 [candidate division WOR-1 bacterium DG_54_3]
MIYPVNLNSQFNYPNASNKQITRIAMTPVPLEEEAGVKPAPKEYEYYEKYNLREGYSIEEILKSLKHEDPKIREKAAHEARFAFLDKEIIKADLKDLKKLKSWEQLNDLLGALRISARDSDYGVSKESKTSLAYARFILEYKGIDPKQEPLLRLPGSPGVSPIIDQKRLMQHKIFREFMIIPLNNTRDFSNEELSTIYKGLQNIPYRLLGGFYSILADKTDYDREDSRASFSRGQIEFKDNRVTLPALFHEIGLSIYKHILTEKQRALFAKLNRKARTDLENYTADYGKRGIDEDFAAMVENWGNNSKAFFNKALKQAMAEKKSILLEKVLVIAEVFAANTNVSNGYKITGNDIKRSYLKISRFNDGKLKSITFGNKTYHFVYGNDERLTKINNKIVY